MSQASRPLHRKVEQPCPVDTDPAILSNRGDPPWYWRGGPGPFKKSSGIADCCRRKAASHDAIAPTGSSAVRAEVIFHRRARYRPHFATNTKGDVYQGTFGDLSATEVLWVRTTGWREVERDRLAPRPCLDELKPPDRPQENAFAGHRELHQQTQQAHKNRETSPTKGQDATPKKNRTPRQKRLRPRPALHAPASALEIALRTT